MLPAQGRLRPRPRLRIVSPRHRARRRARLLVIRRCLSLSSGGPLTPDMNFSVFSKASAASVTDAALFSIWTAPPLDAHLQPLRRTHAPRLHRASRSREGRGVRRSALRRPREPNVVVDHRACSNGNPSGSWLIEIVEDDLVAPYLAEKIRPRGRLLLAPASLPRAPPKSPAAFPQASSLGRQSRSSAAVFLTSIQDHSRGGELHCRRDRLVIHNRENLVERGGRALTRKVN